MALRRGGRLVRILGMACGCALTIAACTKPAGPPQSNWPPPADVAETLPAEATATDAPAAVSPADAPSPVTP